MVNAGGEDRRGRTPQTAGKGRGRVVKIKLQAAGTFTLAMGSHPVAENHPGDRDALYAPVPVPGRMMAVILIVEDEVFIRQAAAWAIEDMGHSPLTAEDLPSALLHLEADQRIDALFVDIRLNALIHGGYEVARRAVALRPDLPVLYASGTPLDAAMSDQFVDHGQFIQKPYSPEILEVSLNRLLTETRATTP